MHHLTSMDIRKLTTEPSGNVRGMLATKIAIDYREGHFTPSESEIAVDIFRMLLRDVEKRVRQSLAEQLCHSPHVPRDIVLKLAHDDVDIGVFVLEHSQVLNEDDLLAIIHSTEEIGKLCAIARRPMVPVRIADSLMETEHTSVLQDLFSNKGAILTEASLLKNWGIIANQSGLLETLVERGGLPLTIAEKLFHLVSDELRQQLVRRYDIDVPVASKAAMDAREWEMLGILPMQTSIDPETDEELEDLIDHLQLQGRLTHSVLIRALCLGAINLFELGMARMAGVPRVNARILLMNGGQLGFDAIYTISGMPIGFSAAIFLLLKISLEESQFGSIKRDEFKKRVIDRIYKEGYHQSVENMPYLLSIIGGKIAASNLH